MQPSSLPSPSLSLNQHHSNLRFYRILTLISLLFTDGTYTILRRYSRGVLNETFSINDVLLVAEVIKLVFSYFMLSRSFSATQPGGGDGKSGDKYFNDDDEHDCNALIVQTKSENHHGITTMKEYIMKLLLGSKKMSYLAVLYGVGNLLSYYALERTGAGTFVVIANLKTLTTAGFSVVLLGRRYSWTKWRALILLILGVVLFVLPTLDNDGSIKHDDVSDTKDRDRVTIAKAQDDDNDIDPNEVIEELSMENTVDGYESSKAGGVALGICLELIVVTLSGYAAIYFEKAIKNDPFNIWERNFQLGFYSILLYASLILSDDNKPFSNWTTMAYTLSILGASGGLLVALSIKYGDSVLKTLAISGSIIYANIVEHIFLGGPLNEQMILSSFVVVIAVINYNFDDS